MQAASLFDDFAFDVFPPVQDGLGASEVDGGGYHVVQSLVAVVVVIDELVEAPLELVR
jgi:hypothetical protein